jgi:hypothetical protein
VKIKWISIAGFKNYMAKHEFTFRNYNIIKGENALGKTTIGDAIAWVLTGCNLYGIEKASARIVNNKAKVTEVVMSFKYNGFLHNVKRLRSGKITDIYLDGYKVTNTELYNKFLIDRECFFSVFNPLYFISLSPAEAKSFLLSILPKVCDESVFKILGEFEQNVLKRNGFKSSSKFIEERRKEITEINEDIIYCHGIIDGQNTDFLNSEEEIFDDTRLNVLENELEKALLDVRLGTKKHTFDYILKEVKVIETTLREATDLEHDYVLRICKLLKDLEDELEKYEESRNQHVSNRLIYVKSLMNDISELKIQAAITEVINKNRLSVEKHRELAKCKIDDARRKIEENTLRIREVNMLIDLAKQFYAKKLELESKSINKYLDKVSIQLQKVVKGTGEIKDDFKILYERRELNTLSHSEKIKAGLEISNLVMQIIDVKFPVFIDDAESITKYKKPFTQIIEARVEKGSKLIIETYE